MIAYVLSTRVQWYLLIHWLEATSRNIISEFSRSFFCLKMTFLSLLITSFTSIQSEDIFFRNKFSALEVSTFWKKFTVGSTLSSFNFPSLFRFSLRQSYLWYCSSLQTNVYRKFDMIILKYGFLFQMKFHWVSLMNTRWIIIRINAFTFRTTLY